MTLVDHPLEVTLRLIADAAPAPWRPLAYLQATGSNPEYVRGLVELLRLEGLLVVGPGAGDGGPEVRLTDLGREVVESPALLDRLRQGRALRPDDPGAIIRESLRHPVRPVVMPVLLVLNFAVFAYCLYLARGDKALMQSYLMSMQMPQAVMTRVLEPAGAVSPADLIAGKWWRLLTACFVHAGLLHIAMNMYTLYAAGQFVEQAWGRWRFAVIYFVAGWGGSCLALAMKPVMLVGASGAICGVLGAEAVWVLTYGRYLPRELARRGRSQLVVTLVLLVIISVLPGVSGWGHLGGAVAGAAAALALHWQRFGPRPLRWLGVPLLALIPLASYAYLARQRGLADHWRQAETSHFRNEVQPGLTKAIDEAADRYRDQVRDVLEEKPGQREPGAVAAANRALDEVAAKLEEVRRRAEALGALRDADDERRRELLIEYARTRLAIVEAARAKLAAGAAWTEEQEKDFQARWEANERVKDQWKQAK